MKKCIIIVNKMSGNSEHIDDNKLRDVLGNGFEVDLIHLVKKTTLEDFPDYDRIVVCGGDGTLNGILNSKHKPLAEIIYCPYGTLNELATGNSHTSDYLLHDVGNANGKKFAYVFASGIFTPLGYVVKNENKRRYKKFAYLAEVVNQYKIHRIEAKMTVDGKFYEGEWSLIMAIDSPKCFGFNFNRMFKLDDGILHLLALRAPKHNGVLGKLELFFPLFRAFFIGFDKSYASKKMFFSPFTHLTISLTQQIDFCMDGECITFSGNVTLDPTHLDNPIHILTPRAIKKRNG